jgi:putative transposase
MFATTRRQSGIEVETERYQWEQARVRKQVTFLRQLAQLAAETVGRGRAYDNIFVERLWRSVKYDDIYPNRYAAVPALFAGLERYFIPYNQERLHQSLDYRTLAAVYFA